MVRFYVHSKGAFKENGFVVFRRLTLQPESILFFDTIQQDHCVVDTNTLRLVLKEIPFHRHIQNLEPNEWLHLKNARIMEELNHLYILVHFGFAAEDLAAIIISSIQKWLSNKQMCNDESLSLAPISSSLRKGKFHQRRNNVERNFIFISKQMKRSKAFL